jgi:hypothetical protein
LVQALAESVVLKPFPRIINAQHLHLYGVDSQARISDHLVYWILLHRRHDLYHCHNSPESGRAHPTDHYQCFYCPAEWESESLETWGQGLAVTRVREDCGGKCLHVHRRRVCHLVTDLQGISRLSTMSGKIKLEDIQHDVDLSRLDLVEVENL